MSVIHEDEAVYSQSQMQIIKDIAEMKAKQGSHFDEFKDHKKEDDEHFTRLYNADREILTAINAIPNKITRCRDDLKAEIHKEVQDHYVGSKEFSIFKTQVITTIAVITTLITLGGVFLNYWLLISKITTP